VREFVCKDCGSAFTVRADILAKYPDTWTPRQCMSCRSGGSSAKGGAVAKAGGARRGGGGGRGRTSSLVEENLTIVEVLEKYQDGPHDGVFTDGSASPNPGPGGWGAVYVKDGDVIAQAYDASPQTTNNRMELTALIHGFDLVPPGEPTTVYTDSKLCVDTITKWAPGWERAGWKRKTGPVQNLDLVKQLYARAKAQPELRLEWIRAHNGSRWNEYADSLSTAYLRDEL
jgi:ribonuclease HI